MRDARGMMGITWQCTQRPARVSSILCVGGGGRVAALCVVLRGGRACGAPRGARGGERSFASWVIRGMTIWRRSGSRGRP
eukprot:2373546-Prymnesium_polylepis.1